MRSSRISPKVTWGGPTNFLVNPPLPQVTFPLIVIYRGEVINAKLS